eukprot:m.44227 g.44227  ORF g.44227 m.44227 type:complete len:113 (-) comp10072_c0_seq1:32-370(-)
MPGPYTSTTTRDPTSDVHRWFCLTFDIVTRDQYNITSLMCSNSSYSMISRRYTLIIVILATKQATNLQIYIFGNDRLSQSNVRTQTPPMLILSFIVSLHYATSTLSCLLCNP